MEPLTLDLDPSPEDVARVREGLPVGVVAEVVRRYGLRQEEVLAAVGIPRSSFHRYRALGRLSPEASDRLYRLLYLLRRAEALFGSPDLAALWMRGPKAFLQGESPLSYLDTEPGFRAVEHLLGRLEDGLVS